MIDLSLGKYETKYMVFEKVATHGWTQDWDCMNKKGGYRLGAIRYLFAWHQYVFIPEPSTEYNKSCMVEIADVLSALNAPTYQQKKRVEANGK